MKVARDAVKVANFHVKVEHNAVKVSNFHVKVGHNAVKVMNFHVKVVRSAVKVDGFRVKVTHFYVKVAEHSRESRRTFVKSTRLIVRDPHCLRECCSSLRERSCRAKKSC
jgi:hypothetical protein